MSRRKNTKFPRRPPRLHEIHSNMNPLFFITFNTYKRKKVLAYDDIHQEFVPFCKKSIEFGLCVGNYVIMPDHVHLFVWLNYNNIGLKRWMISMKRVLSKKLSSNNIGRPHWQESFFDHLLRSEEDFRVKSDYVTQNPVRAGLCEKAEDWPYAGKINRIYWG